MGHIYFASDFHLGVDFHHSPSREREHHVCRWLEQIPRDAERLYLAGDLFDFWFEYRYVVPKGQVRFLGQLAAMRDKGIPIECFIGNHDMWMFDYLEQELGIPVHRRPIIREHGGKRFFIGHGDGLGPNDYGYKRLKKVFAHPLCQWMFKWLHPDLGISLARTWSAHSRQKNDKAHSSSHFLGEREEWLIAYCERKLQELEVDYFVFGHRHLPLDYTLSDEKTRYINLGEWMQHRSYARFDGQNMELLFFENPQGKKANP